MSGAIASIPADSADVSFSRALVDDVMVVDDDPVVRAVTEVFFKKRGTRNILTAGSGFDALEAVERLAGRTSLLVFELDIPGPDGIQLMRRLGELGFSGGVLILSKAPEALLKVAEALGRTHNLNVIGALKKPLKIDQLEALVAEFSQGPERAELVPLEPIDIDELTFGLANGEITAYYQPKIAVDTLTVTGVEALARWEHPELGFISPGRFVPTAEEFGLIGELTETILNDAIGESRRWHERGLDLHVSVNISSQLLTRIGFPDQVKDSVTASGLKPENFIMEVTESRLVQNDATCAEVLARLRLMGFGLSIDDFGTGYSNIENLRDFPFSELKIDQSFVQNAASDPFAKASIDASVSLGRNMGLRIVAEGIETAQDWVTMVEAGVDEIQGYYVAKPMSGRELERWMLGGPARDR